MSTGRFPRARTLWLTVMLLLAPLLPLAGRSTAAQTGITCGTACTFVPLVNDLHKVYLESVDLTCERPDLCVGVAGTIHNGLDVPVADVSLVLLPPSGVGGAPLPIAASVMYRGIAPGESVRFIAGLSGPQPPFGYAVERFAVERYTVNPTPPIRQLTIVEYHWEPGPPAVGTLKVTLRNDTRDRVDQIRVLIATDPDGRGWEAYTVNTPGRVEWYPIPALASGQSTVFVFTPSPRTPYRNGYFPFGAEGVVVP